MPESINYTPGTGRGEQHFTLQRRESIQVMRFETSQSVHALFNMLLNFCAHIKKDHSSQTPVSIIAPKPFLNCFHKECDLTSNGKVATEQKLTLRFNGLIFPQQLSRVCQRIQAISKNANGQLKRATV